MERKGLSKARKQNVNCKKNRKTYLTGHWKIASLLVKVIFHAKKDLTGSKANLSGSSKLDTWQVRKKLTVHEPSTNIYTNTRIKSG